jgi:undecaprenol kinase
MLSNKSKGLAARLKSFIYALAGLRVLFQEPNFVIHLSSALLVIILGFLIGIKKVEWLFLMFSIGLVLFAETVNTSIEYLVDLVSPNYHVLAKKCKDVAAFSVLLSALLARLVGIIIFLPYFL